MRKGTVVRLKGFRLLAFLSNNSILVILTLLFVIGVTLGTFTCQKVSLLQTLSEGYLQAFTGRRSNPSFLPLFLHSFMSSMLLMFLCFALGTSIFGMVLSPLFFAARGLLYGSVTALLYSTYSVKGIAYNAVLVLPSALFFILALLLAVRESVKFSMMILKITFPSTGGGDLSSDFGNYCGRYLVLSALVLLSALIDALISCGFAEKFVL